MDTDYQVKKKRIEERAPLFESIWLALFFMLRQEYLQARGGSR